MLYPDSIYSDQIDTVAAVAALFLAAIFVNFVIKKLLLKGLDRLIHKTSFGRDKELRRYGVIPRLANTMPLFVISIGIEMISGLPDWLATTISNVTHACMILTLAMAIAGIISVIDTILHRRRDQAQASIKGYFQLGKIAIYAVAVILIIAALSGRSPVILLSGIGAMAAVLTLVFQDTLLSFVAALQISSNDVVRVGDWISMPSVGADGDVIEIGLHTVKVRNFDKTITTIPTRKLATDSFANWRGMQESGGRRIKRSVHLDQHSIRFLDQDDLNRLEKVTHLRDYVSTKSEDISKWNAKLGGASKVAANTRRLTNIGMLRAYLDTYLRNHPGINSDMTLMVRQLASGAKGVPLEIYCFTGTTAWTEYEGIQADIFDHLLAILPEFDLCVFQEVAGSDIMRARTTDLITAA